MYLTIHGHFYQPPRENPWTGRIPRQESAAPDHDWNERITAQCYAPNARSRVLDEFGRIEEIVNNYNWVQFDFGPTLLRWLETGDPDLYKEILRADRDSAARFGGHGNAIAQAYNHMILPLASYRDQVTQVRWGLRDFQFRFGRPSESIWLPETAMNLETLRILVESGIRFIILAPHQARRVKRAGGGSWSDVSGGRIDPRRAYRWTLPADPSRGLDVFFYDGPISVAVSFEHLLRNASVFADRLQAAARDAGPDALVHMATDGEVYGHHEPFGDMCLAYLLAREAPLRGIRPINYGAFLDAHPPKDLVEIDLGESGEGTSWSCVHGIGRWCRDCGCSTGGRPGWHQRWRAPLRRGLDFLRDRLYETYAQTAGDLVRDPWEARDDYVDVLLDPNSRSRFIEKHARRPLDDREREVLWRMLESQHNAMLMYTSCAWFFADISGLEVQQNLAYAARAIELARPHARANLEDELLGYLSEAKSNLAEMGSGADVYRRFVQPMRKTPAMIAVEAAGMLAAAGDGSLAGGPAFDVKLGEIAGRWSDGGVSGVVAIEDRRTTEGWSFRFAARPDTDALLLISVRADGEGELIERRVDDLPPELRLRLIRSLLAERHEQEESRFDAVFETDRGLMERYHRLGLELPPIFAALAQDVVRRRCSRIAADLGEIPPAHLTGRDVTAAASELLALAEGIGVTLATDPIAGVIETALDANLNNPANATSEDVRRSIDLLSAAESIGIRVHRTTLEDRAYALLSHYREPVAARLAGRTPPPSRVEAEILIQLAEQANLSLRAWDRAPISNR